MNYADIFLDKPKNGFKVNLSNPTVNRLWSKYKRKHGLSRAEYADKELIEKFNKYATHKIFDEISRDNSLCMPKEI